MAKHGIAFDEAATCLLDPHARVLKDTTASGEARSILLGMSSKGRLLSVAYTLRQDYVRLISARKATKKEAISYA